jgi:hypothetical protein
VCAAASAGSANYAGVVHRLHLRRYFHGRPVVQPVLAGDPRHDLFAPHAGRVFLALEQHHELAFAPARDQVVMAELRAQPRPHLPRDFIWQILTRQICTQKVLPALEP